MTRLHKQLLLALAAFVVFGAVAYFVSVVFRSASMYQKVTTDYADCDASQYEYDPELGYRPIAGTSRTFAHPIAGEVTTSFDMNGFRMPAHDEESPAGAPRILVLGGSFSHGYLCQAEDTYGHVVSKARRSILMNAAVPGYGAAQVWQVGTRLISELKPDLVLVQYSPWLISRATRAYAPSFLGRLPVSYFARDSGDALWIAPPLFEPIISRLPLQGYATKEPALGDRWSFLFRVAMPLCTYDDLHVAGVALKGALGFVPTPATGRESDIVEFVYGGLNELCRTNGCKLLVVAMGMGPDPVPIPEALHRVPGVNAHGVMIGRLERPGVENYTREYAHVGPGPRPRVDFHPNERAHGVVAEAILKDLERRGW